MNFKNVFTWTLALTALLFLAACEKEDFAPTGNEAAITKSRSANSGAKKEGKDKGNKGNGGDTTDTDTDTEAEPTYVGTYQVTEANNDPLYRFSFTAEEDWVLLETDPSVGNFGTDFFGEWADPFAVIDHEATWTQGLNTFIWTFERISLTEVNVTETHIQRPYLSGETTTTVTDLGVYELLP